MQKFVRAPGLEPKRTSRMTATAAVSHLAGVRGRPLYAVASYVRAAYVRCRCSPLLELPSAFQARCAVRSTVPRGVEGGRGAKKKVSMPKRYVSIFVTAAEVSTCRFASRQTIGDDFGNTYVALVDSVTHQRPRDCPATISALPHACSRPGPREHRKPFPPVVVAP